MTDPSLDPYKALQVDPEAEDEVVAAAYRRLARKYHPDIATEPEAAARMAAINAAWAIIGDPERRAAFDRKRAMDAAMGRRDAETGTAPPRPEPPAAERVPEPGSSDWSSGRSSVGGGYDPSMRTADGAGAAGPPPGNPSGGMVTFGRYAGWSLGEIARTDLDYIEWLDRMPIGRPYGDEIDAILRQAGRRGSGASEASERRGLFRRR